MADSTQVTLPAMSMFMDTPVGKTTEGDIVFGLLRDPVIPDPTDKVYSVPQPGENRGWLISAHCYTTPHLWWVLAMVNGMLDPLTEFTPGRELRVPTSQRLSDEGVKTI